MKALDHISKLGLEIEFDSSQGKIRVRNRTHLTSEGWVAAREYLQKFKNEIIAALKEKDNCPHSPEDLDKYEREYPHLACCPNSDWNFRRKQDCKDCVGHNYCRFRPLDEAVQKS